VWGDQSKPVPLQVEPKVLSGQTLEFECTSFSEVVERCTALGFQIIGAAWYNNQRELSGILPARWRPLHYMPNSAWFCAEEKDKWSEIAHAARKRDMGRLWDCSARISYQIETCIARLEDISDRYSAQLRSLVEGRRFPNQSRVENLWTQSIFRALQAFLSEACILRDYLAEFAAAHVYTDVVPSGVTTLAKLLPYIRRSQLSDVVTDGLKTATAGGGWLTLLGQYRNLVIHSAPLAMAKKHLWVWCQTHDLPRGEKLPVIRVPLPNDPAEIMALRRKTDYEKFSAIADQFAGDAGVAAGMIDALRYSHQVLGKLGELAALLALRSPVPPEIPVLTEEDLAGPFKWDG
jgi:hypothetical protein